jgi:predicted ATPase
MGARGWVLLPTSPSLKPQVPSEAVEEVEGYFLKAIEIARQQSAKLLELRATVSLSRVWQQQGKKKKDIHKMLSEIYNWFTEGFDTKDLQEAKTLLEELT